MIKSLVAADRSEKDRFSVPSSVQKSIPVRCIYKDGIWQVGSKFSKTWRFADINYAVASHDDQTELFMAYCALINALPTDGCAKITVSNRRINSADFEKSMLMGKRGDSLDRYRGEYNGILAEKAAASNNLAQEKYITISTQKKNIEEARSYFHRVDNDLGKGFAKLASGAKPLDTHDRLRILHDFFRPGEEQYFRFDLSESMRLGHDFRDAICPDGLEFKSDHFVMGGKVGRVLFLREYPSYLKDSMISDLSDFSCNLMLSIDLIPVPTDEAVKEMQNRMLSVETDITRFFQKNTTVAAVVPYGLEQLRQETKEYMDDLTSRDQRMIFATVTLVHIADDLDQLNADTETLLSIGRKYLCQFSTLRYQQEDGLNTALPYGLRRIKAIRTLTTESAAVLMPFNVQDVMDTGGNYYGQNAVSRNLIVCNRKRLLAGHGFMLGITGSGKSFAAKGEIAVNALSTNDDIILVDPEREVRREVA